MKSVKSIIFTAALLLLAASTIYLIMSHTSTSETFLKNTQDFLEVEDEQLANELRKYLESEITGAEVIECIRTYGTIYSIDVNFLKKDGSYVTRTITDVSKYLDPMNQVDAYGHFDSAIQNDNDEAWIDSNVRYFATLKKSNNTIVGLIFTPIDGQKSSYNYSGATKYVYYQKLWELSQNYATLTKLQEELNYKLQHLLSIDTATDYSDSIFSSRIEPLYDDYAKIYFYYGAFIDDGWDKLNQLERDELLLDNTKCQVLRFFRPDWDGYELNEIWDTKLPNLDNLAKPIRTSEGEVALAFSYEISGTTTDLVTMVIQQKNTDNYSVNLINNNSKTWVADTYQLNNTNKYLSMGNGRTFKFLIYDSNLKMIKEHFNAQYPTQIKTLLQEALTSLSNVDKDWNKWEAEDKDKLQQARTSLIKARALIKSYYDSYVQCRQACESLRNKSNMPSCVYDLYTRSLAAEEITEGDFSNTIHNIEKNSSELWTLDHNLDEVIDNNNINESNFFGTNNNGYLNTALLIMNKSVDVSALRGTSSADNEYKDYVDNAILEIDELLAREVD